MLLLGCPDQYILTVPVEGVNVLVHVAGIGSSIPTRPKRIQRVLKRDGWMDDKDG